MTLLPKGPKAKNRNLVLQQITLKAGVCREAGP